MRGVTFAGGNKEKKNFNRCVPWGESGKLGATKRRPVSMMSCRYNFAAAGLGTSALGIWLGKSKP